MSQPVLNSNSNSALLNTLLNTESLRIPAEYSTKIIDYPHAVNYTKIDSNATHISEGSQITIPLLKYGIATQILLNYTKTLTVTTTSGRSQAKLHAGDIFRVINRVELMSSSRVLSTLTSEGLQAQIAGMTQDQLTPVYSNAVRPRNYDSDNTGTAGNAFAISVMDPTPNFAFSLPLVFGLFEQQGIMNLSFLENCSIRITFGKINCIADKGTIASDAHPITNLNLTVRYQVYPEEAQAKILASNFNENDLNVLTTRQFFENPIEHSYVANPALSSQGVPFVYLQNQKVDLKNVDVVSKYYVIVRSKGTPSNAGTTMPDTHQGTGTNLGVPLQISGLALFASGQEILRLNQNEIDYAMLESNGYAVKNNGLLTGFGTGCGLQNIAVLPIGLFSNHMVITNGMSLRELNNLQLEVQWYATPESATNDSKFQVDVVEETLAIYNIASSTGRIGLSLAN